MPAIPFKIALTFLAAMQVGVLDLGRRFYDHCDSEDRPSRPDPTTIPALQRGMSVLF